MTLSMSVLAGALALSKHHLESGNPIGVCVSSLAKGLAGYGHYDYSSAADLIVRLSWVDRDDLENDWHDRLFALIDLVVMAEWPSWVELTPMGRSFAVAEMDQGAKQCLRDAGLLSDADEAREWWDKLQHLARQRRAEELLAVGREGERLSMERERGLLKQAGRPDLSPRWDSLDNNNLGFDISSWHLERLPELTPKTIEVKAGRSNPVLIHISRGQWNHARNSKNHEFHIWDLTSKSVRVLPGSAIAEHAPSDCGDGQWSEFTLAVDVTPDSPS